MTNSDSGYEDDANSESSTTSVASPLRRLMFATREEFGRQYLLNKRSLRPFDDDEEDFLDRQHFLSRYIFGKANPNVVDKWLAKDPIERESKSFQENEGYYSDVISPPPTNILDFGAQTGIWAIQLADSHPSATVTGWDELPRQPKEVPPNCEFEECNIEETCTFKYPIDLIHIRFMLGRFRNWRKVFRNAFSLLQQGGYLQIIEQDFNYRSSDKAPKKAEQLPKLFGYIKKAYTMEGCDLYPIETLICFLRGAGFEIVEHKTHDVPVGFWHPKKRLGRIHLSVLESLIPSLGTKAIIDNGVLEQDEYDASMAYVRHEMVNPKMEISDTFHRIVVRKPM